MLVTVMLQVSIGHYLVIVLLKLFRRCDDAVNPRGRGRLCVFDARQYESLILKVEPFEGGGCRIVFLGGLAPLLVLRGKEILLLEKAPVDVLLNLRIKAEDRFYFVLFELMLKLDQGRLIIPFLLILNFSLVIQVKLILAPHA